MIKAYQAILVLILGPLLLSSCLSTADRMGGEEYYELGSAYYELGKFSEAERWFLKAKSLDKTRLASEYQLGRIAFETGKTEAAALIFESLLQKDPENILALKGAAFSRLKMGDFDAAYKHYKKVALLLPESLDSSYNYALVLHALNKDDSAIEILKPLIKIKGPDKESLLLLARSQRALDYPEALDSYEQALVLGEDMPLRREYASLCEKLEFYARAAENYRLIIQAGTGGTARAADQFALSRVLLIAGEEDGLTQLQAALEQGFKDRVALDALLSDERIMNREELTQLIEEMREKSKSENEGNISDGI
ncbi:hypothetical protein MASR2M78_32540 [Treponema sp.]